MIPPRGFRRRDAAALAAHDFGPNMTPMVDIVMVILIFFMAGTAFIGPEWFLSVGVAPGAAAKPPDAEAQRDFDIPAARSALRLRVGPDGAAVVTGLGLTDAGIAALADRLDEYQRTGAAKSVRVVIEPSLASSYQDVIRVYDLCQRAGFESVGLAKADPGSR